jgi:hypothetical protein
MRPNPLRQILTAAAVAFQTSVMLQHLASADDWQETDSTRVISKVMRQKISGGMFAEFGVSKGFHELTDHGKDPKSLAEPAKVDRICMSKWNHFPIA